MNDQSELTWFLTQGISVFERSTTGPILDKLEMDAYVSRICPICSHGVIVESSIRRNGGRLRWVRDSKVGDWCQRCNGVGVLPMRLSPEEQALADSGEWASSDREGQRSAVPDAVLVRYAFVSRALSRMPPTMRDALTLAYGDEGEEVSHTVLGRSWACTPLTAAGSALLTTERERRVRAEGIEPERPIQCMVALTRLGAGKSHPERSKLLALAAAEAIVLLRRAEAIWDRLVEDQTGRLAS
jgi:hypothetical protein